MIHSIPLSGFGVWRSVECLWSISRTHFMHTFHCWKVSVVCLMLLCLVIIYSLVAFVLITYIKWFFYANYVVSVRCCSSILVWPSYKASTSYVQYVNFIMLYWIKHFEGYIIHVICVFAMTLWCDVRVLLCAIILSLLACELYSSSTSGWIFYTLRSFYLLLILMCFVVILLLV